MVEKIKFGKNIKYYKDAFSLQYILGLTGILIISVIGVFSIYATYSSYEGSKFSYLLLPLILLIILRLLFGNYFRKIAIDENGNVSIPGEGTDPFMLNTFYSRPVAKGHNRYIQFDKANIKNIDLVDRKNIKKSNVYDTTFLSRTKKVILIEFKEPLKFYVYPGTIQIGERKSLEGIYLSLGDSDSFIEDIGR